MCSTLGMLQLGGAERICSDGNKQPVVVEPMPLGVLDPITEGRLLIHPVAVQLCETSVSYPELLTAILYCLLVFCGG